MSMALVMSQMPDVWRRVLAEHVPDGGGRCQACRSTAGVSASWPCQTYKVGQEARWVAEGNLPGTGPHSAGLHRSGPSAAPYVGPPEPGYARERRREPAFAGGFDAPSGGFRAGPPSGGFRSGPPSGGFRSGPPSGGFRSGPDSGHFRPGPDSGGFRSGPPSGGVRTGGHRIEAGRERHDTGGHRYDTGGYRHDTGGHRYDTGARSYGSAVDAPYGSSFGIDDGPRAPRW